MCCQKKSFAVNRRQDTLSSSSKQGFVISKIFMQNAHGLRCRPRNEDGNICPNSPVWTSHHNLEAEATWGDVFDKTINRYHVFCHNGEIGNHNFHGVAIILSPCYQEGWKATGAWQPITTDAKGKFTGWFISLNIKLASNDCFGKK
jgi:hypothetical protein